MRLFFVLFKHATRRHVFVRPPRKAPKTGIITKAFTTYLFATNTLTSSLLMAVGDYIQQQIEHYQHKPLAIPYDLTRTKNLMTVALGHGVFHHYFYAWMDRLIPHITVRGTLYKILLDQFIAGPVCITFFFITMGLLNTGKLQTGVDELKKKFLFVFGVDWVVWPPAQFVNFYYVPLQYRVVYINTVTMLYNVFLSYVKHYDQPNTAIKI